MGTGIAQVFAQSGYKTLIYDVDRAQVERAPNTIASNLSTLAERGLVHERDAQRALQLLEPTDRIEEMARASYVTECVPEDLQLKQEVFATLDSICRPSTILATNTSVMRISEIASRSKHTHRIVGTHWWNPPFLLPLVEVVPGRDTSESVMEATMNWLQRLGKRPVKLNREVPGFIGNRLQHALWREALALVQSGVADPETVDACIKYSFGRRLAVLAPFENMDLVGLDLTLSIHQYLFPYLDNSTEPFQVIQEKVANQQLGFKSGIGFREWSTREMADLRQRLFEHLIEWAKLDLQQKDTPRT